MKETKPPTLMDLWIHAWKWMQDEGGIVLIKNSLADRAVNHNDGYHFYSCLEGNTPEKMAYYITAHFENREDEPPDHLKKIVEDYQIKMMNLWGWPVWGYKKVMHLNPNK